MRTRAIRYLSILIMMFALTGCFEYVHVTATGDPAEPTLSFEKPIGLGTLEVIRYDEPHYAKSEDVWLIGQRASTELFITKEIRYGHVPAGHEELVKKQPLMEGKLYCVSIPGGGYKGRGCFAIVSKNGQKEIINIDIINKGDLKDAFDEMEKHMRE